MNISKGSLKRIALFAAFSMFCATLEYLFPRPVVFFRLGLANLPIILALPLMNFKSLILLVLMKVLGQALVNGTLASYVFLLSLVGSFASFILMYLCHKFLHLSYIGTSLAGALASNTVQGLFSILFIFGRESWVILPILYGLGFAAGLTIGIIAEVIARKSYWFHDQYSEMGIAPRIFEGWKTQEKEKQEEREKPIVKPENKGDTPPVKSFLERHLSTRGACISGALAIPLFLMVKTPLPRLIQVIILGILVLLTGKKLFYRYFLFLMTSVTFFHLLSPQGRVIFSIGRIIITEGALSSGMYRGLSVIGLIFISLLSIRKDLVLPGKTGELIRNSLRYFEELYHYRKQVTRHHLISYIDNALYYLEGLNLEEKYRSPQQTGIADIFIIIGIEGLLAIPLFYEVLFVIS